MERKRDVRSGRKKRAVRVRERGKRENAREREMWKGNKREGRERRIEG